MRRETVGNITLLALVVLISGVFLAMIQQFLMSIFMAGLFTAMVRPLHRKLTARLGGRQILASILTVLAIICLVLTPLAVLITVVVSQAINIGQAVTPWVQTFINEPSAMTVYLEKIPYYQEILPYRDVIIGKIGEMVGAI